MTTIEKRTTVNRALLLEVLAYIEAHPENWSQEAWATLKPGVPFTPDKTCGTSFCFAGHALAREGFVPFFNDYDLSERDARGAATSESFIPLSLAKKITKALEKGKDTAKLMNKVEEEYVSPSDGAADLLGLTRGQAADLFRGSNTLEDIRRVVCELVLQSDSDQAFKLDRGY